MNFFFRYSVQSRNKFKEFCNLSNPIKNLFSWNVLLHCLCLVRKEEQRRKLKQKDTESEISEHTVEVRHHTHILLFPWWEHNPVFIYFFFWWHWKHFARLDATFPKLFRDQYWPIFLLSFLFSITLKKRRSVYKTQQWKL